MRRLKSRKGDDHVACGIVRAPGHLARLSQEGDPLKVLHATVHFEYFQDWLVQGLGYGDSSKGGWLPFDRVSMFKALTCGLSTVCSIRGWSSCSGTGSLGCACSFSTLARRRRTRMRSGSSEIGSPKRGRRKTSDGRSRSAVRFAIAPTACRCRLFPVGAYGKDVRL